jgi:hypothetical protein
MKMARKSKPGEMVDVQGVPYSTRLTMVRDGENITGRCFGLLTVIGPAGVCTDNGTPYWECRCACGKGSLATYKQLYMGVAAHCGGHDDAKPEEDPHADAALLSAFESYKYGAAQRDLPWELTLDDFKVLTQQECYYCGDPPSNKRKVFGYTYVYSGIDRMDNKRGYTAENCVASCKICNFMKRTMKKHDFIKQVKKIAKRFA